MGNRALISYWGSHQSFSVACHAPELRKKPYTFYGDSLSMGIVAAVHECINTLGRHSCLYAKE